MKMRFSNLAATFCALLAGAATPAASAENASFENLVSDGYEVAAVIASPDLAKAFAASEVREIYLVKGTEMMICIVSMELTGNSEGLAIVHRGSGPVKK